VSAPRRQKVNPSRTLRTKVPKVWRVRILAAMALALAVSLFASAPAFAGSPPEAPIMQCNPLVIPAGGPFVCGTLNPHSKEKLTSAYFTFSAGSTCTGGTQIAVEPEVQWEEDMEVRAKLEGLAPGTEYASCLVAVNSSGKTVSDPLTFTTTAEPKSEPAAAVMTTSARLEGTLEPAGTKLKYRFYYSKGPTCEGGVPTAQAEGENKVSAQVEGLRSNIEYTFCLGAEGNDPYFISPGEQNVGTVGAKPVHFRTLETQAEKEAKEKLEQEAKAKAEAEVKAQAEAKAKAEAEAVAAKRKQEEAAAAAKRQQEEEAAKKKQEEKAAEATGSVSLDGTTIDIQSSGEAAVKLTCTGTGTCSGKLTLTAKSMTKKGKKTKTIGTATFSISAEKTATIKFTLNASGRALLGADHGRLSASLTVLKSSPVPSQAHTENVHLVREKSRSMAKR
jgi:hypothetical protein